MIAGRLFGGKIMEGYNKEKLIVTFLPAMVVILAILSISKLFLCSFLWGCYGE
jgi:hypothetical protein